MNRLEQSLFFKLCFPLLLSKKLPGKIIDDMKLVEINELFEEVKEKSIEVVSGHGFCLFIKRTLINEIGGFNEKEFARIRGGK